MYMQYVTEYDVINISDTRPQKNMITMGKIDTSYLMMIVTWGINISFQSPELKWVSWTHTTPYILMTKVIERTSSILDTPPQDKLYMRLHVLNACEPSCIMRIYFYEHVINLWPQQWCIIWSAWCTPIIEVGNIPWIHESDPTHQIFHPVIPFAIHTIMVIQWHKMEGKERTSIHQY